MMGDVHVDEKWFYLTKNKWPYILAPGEQAPERSIQHKSHIEKVMFLNAQAQPCHDTDKNQYWDGKIGVWPDGHAEKLKAGKCWRNTYKLVV